MEKNTSYTKYLAVFSITILVFLLGIILGNYLASFRVSEVKQIQEKLAAQLVGLELRDELLKYKDICNLTWQDIWEEKVDMGAKMVALETRLGKTNPDILLQKEIYELVEIRTLLLLKEVKQKCNASINIIIYFYTNKEKDPKGSYALSEDQGYVLDALFRKYGDKINVFAFDINTDNPAVNALKSIYSVKRVPSLVINDKLYPGLKKLSTLEKILFSES
jgi:hypothetical protein